MKLLVRCGFDSCDSCDHFQCDAHFDIATDQQLFKSSEAIRGGPQGMVQAETEHKATITVTAIVTCFTITQSAICTILGVLGKALNFVLFCLSSASF
ncbi:hypothetical protein L3Y34_002139 [Caenorhabditis briggsae]|uniref:Uncharacterized protein n=1 Tax=Caenorhabditis briggsae TaxID=6238 RepID=A0AAE9DF55_CAEBR|nr:hypothetical protein L3Y34_002139 [Caenorhabditis briggsae]